MSSILQPDTKYLCHVGAETDLIFNRGVDLPNFSLYPFVETAEGRDIINGYFAEHLEMCAAHGMGALVETPTWMANLDRAETLGHNAEDLDRINREAVKMARAACANATIPVVISGNVGPRDDAYAPSDQMSVEGARAYHAAQMNSLAAAKAGIASGYTLTYTNEAEGMVLAARDADLPVVIAFTVETDGNLPDGTKLADAIADVDAQTDGYAEYFMINCAHPDHFGGTLDDAMATGRLRGLVANASRCSHAELDEAEELDDGNPPELGGQMAALAAAWPDLQVFGGCCGTDARHIREMAAALNG